MVIKLICEKNDYNLNFYGYVEFALFLWILILLKFQGRQPLV